MTKKIVVIISDYGKWFRKQSPERKAAAREHTVNAKAFGELQRTEPFSERTKEMAAKIAAHYERWPKA